MAAAQHRGHGEGATMQASDGYGTPIQGIAICLWSLTFAGCVGMTHTQRGALVGSGLGALTGAVVGGASGHPEGGALIGAAAGGLIGGALGHDDDVREFHAASLAEARHIEQIQNSLTNFDLIRLTQSGVSDAVIISAVRSRGGYFDLSPDGIIGLKSNGVSDEVIVSIQEISRLGSTGPVIPVSVPPVVIVRPPPVVGVGFTVGSGPSRRHHPSWWFHHHHIHGW